MSVQEVSGIVPGDRSEVHDEPHVEGTRVLVRVVQARVEEAERPPAAVAESLGIDVADVYAALTYYHRNPEEMDRAEQRHRRATEIAAERSTLSPPDGSDRE